MWGNDANRYVPALKANAQDFMHLEVEMSSVAVGKAQLFFKTHPAKPYAEEQSIRLDVEPGERSYVLPLKAIPGWQGPIRGIRFDPVESGSVTGGLQNNLCVKS